VYVAINPTWDPSHTFSIDAASHRGTPDHRNQLPTAEGTAERDFSKLTISDARTSQALHQITDRSGAVTLNLETDRGFSIPLGG
jgi:hypothetical protein